MAYDRIMKRHARNRSRNRQILSIPQRDWRGVNSVDGVYTMPAHQIPPAQNVDLGSPIGDIAKVAGYESIFASLGAGPVRGLHAWEHSDGDKLILAWDKYLYLLSGDSGSVYKGSQADWEEGESVGIDTITSPGDIQIAKSGVDFSATATNTADFSGAHSNTVAASDKVVLTSTTSGNAIANEGTITPINTSTYSYDIAWGFTVGPNNVTATKLRIKPYYSGTYLVKLWDVAAETVLASASITVTGGVWAEGDIANTTLTAGAKYLISYRHPGGLYNANANGGDYVLDPSIASSDGIGNNFGHTNDMPGTGGSGILTVNVVLSRTSYSAIGTYTHPAQDISGVGTSKTATITFNKTTPASTTCTVDVRVSTDGGATWGAWTAKNSGDTIIAAGTDVSNAMVQVRANLSTTSAIATPSLDDFTIAVTSAYETEAAWEYYYDLGVTPNTVTLSYTVSAPAGTSVTVFAAGSSNGTVFGDWQLVATSGGAAPRARYIKVKFVMTSPTSVTPKASDFLIGHSTSYTKPNRLDIAPLGRTDNKLTGNRVSCQNYDERLYCADGLRPFVLYVDDDTVATGTAQSQELLTNNEFNTYTGTIDDDTGDTFTDWTNQTGGTGRTEAVTGEGGSGVAMKATQTDATAQDQRRGVMQERTLADMGLAVGDIISASARYKNSAQVGAYAQIVLSFRTDAGASLGQMLLVQATAQTAEYAVAMIENVTIPAGTTRIRSEGRIWASGAYSGQNNQLWVESISCAKADQIKLASGASAVDDFYNNAFITITGGTGAGQVRFISDYNGTTKIATVSEGWDTAPDATSTYSIGPAVKVRNAGVDAPTSACTAADGGGTGITGTFRYKTTYVNRDGYESNPSPASNSINVSNKTVALSNIPTGGATIAARKVYRTKTGGSVYYYVGTVDGNTTTTYSDTTADAALVTLMLDNNNIPPNCSLVYLFVTYMFYAFMDELWYAKATEAEAVPAIVGDVQSIICPAAIADIKSNPMALVPMGEDFIAPITSSSGFIFDSDPLVDTTTMRQIGRSGSTSAWASDICVTPDLRSILTFPTRAGVMTLLPGLQEGSVDSFPLSRDVQTYFDRSVDWESMAGIFHNGRYRISFKYLAPGASEAVWVTFICDFRQEAREWIGPWTYGASCYAVIDGNLYAGDPEHGKVHLMDTGNSFDGENIHMIADARMISPKGENFTYKFNNFMFMVSADSDTSELLVKAKVDSQEATIEPGALVDTFTGDRRPGHDNIPSRKFRIPLPRGKTLSYRFEDDSTNPIRIQKIITEAEVLPLKR